VDQDPAVEPTYLPPPLPPPPLPPPPPPLTGWGPQAEDPRVKAAWIKILIALILAAVNFVICGFLCIPAFVLALMGLADLKRLDEPPGHYRVLAILALILAIIGILFLLGIAVFLAWTFATSGTWP